jgi:hypothetical protein
MSYEKELEILRDLRRIHREWTAEVARTGLSKAANTSDYPDAWTDPDRTEATPNEETAFLRRIEQLDEVLDAMLLTATAHEGSGLRSGDDQGPRIATSTDGYGPTPDEARRNAIRAIEDLRFFVTAFGKVADALFMQHKLSRQLYVRDEKQWVRLPEGLRHVLLRHVLKPENINEVTVDAVALWDSRYRGDYVYRGELASLRLHAAEPPRHR